jgi:FMN phosphatase YigB (HAD superfamily)
VTPAALLADLDGTLYHPFPVKAALAAELALAGRTALPALRRFRREHERLRADLVAPVPDPFRLQVERTAAAAGMSPEALAALVDEWMFRRPLRWLRLARRRRVLAELAAFRGAGGAVAVVSDYPARAKLAALGAADLPHVVVASGEPGGPGRLKPWPDGYLLAAERLGLPPARCLVLGDRPDADGEAARRAGMAFRRVG